MKNFKTSNCEVQFSVEELCAKNLKLADSKKVTVKSKSELFRTLYDMGMEICEIARECGSHYSFVYGVISASREVRTVDKTSKSDEIRKMVDEGKTPGEIAKLLNSNYSFVFSVVKKYRASKETTAVVAK
jgi:DNA invertase Pin-like site-specific DNA recombinase